MIPPRVSLITLAVADVARARRFYEAWGWQAAAESQAGIAFFQLGGTVLGLYPAADLARDLGRDLPPAGDGGSGAITLAINFRDRTGVDAAHAEALAAGARALTPPGQTHYGGYVGYVADPDGHVWEFAYVPAFLPAADGTLTLPSLAGRTGA